MVNYIKSKIKRKKLKKTLPDHLYKYLEIVYCGELISFSTITYKGITLDEEFGLAATEDGKNPIYLPTKLTTEEYSILREAWCKRIAVLR